MQSRPEKNELLNLEDLPLENLDKILSYLKIEKSIEAALLNKNFFNLIYALWQSKFFRYFPLFSAIFRIYTSNVAPKKNRSISTLNISK